MSAEPSSGFRMAEARLHEASHEDTEQLEQRPCGGDAGTVWGEWDAPRGRLEMT